MTLVAQSAPEGGQSFTPRRAAIAAGALGVATLFGMALGSMPAFTQGTTAFRSRRSAMLRLQRSPISCRLKSRRVRRRSSSSRAPC